VGIFLFSETAATGNTYAMGNVCEMKSFIGFVIRQGVAMEIYWQKLFNLKCMPILYLIQYVKQIKKIDLISRNKFL